MAAIIVTTKKIAAPVRQANTGPYFCNTKMNAAAHRNDVVTNSAIAAAPASEVSRSAVPVESLKSSISRWNMGSPRFEKTVNEIHSRAPASPLRNEVRFAGARHRRWRRIIGARHLSAPGHADQKAD